MSPHTGGTFAVALTDMTESLRGRKENCVERRLPAASAINSLVQSASAASAREATPGADVDSGPERNSAAQSPESASAATSGAALWKCAMFRMLKSLSDSLSEITEETLQCSSKEHEKHLSVEPVCSSAGQFAAFPPTADPCRRCAPVVAAPGGTHLLTANKYIGTILSTGNSQQIRAASNTNLLFIIAETRF